MIDHPTLSQWLWPQDSTAEALQVYALLDGARDETIAPAIWGSSLPYECLYAGSLSRSLGLAAPYLVQLAPGSHFFEQLVKEGWGRAWGIFVMAQPEVTLKIVRKHLRTLLRVQSERNEILLFRFYDPRVLRVYLPTCTPSELSAFFGPICAFLCEDETGREVLYHERCKLFSKPGVDRRRIRALRASSATLPGSIP